MSPRMIMTGQQLNQKNVEFQVGEYVQVTEPPRAPTTLNSMDERTSDTIYCRPSGNAQGGFWVYKLSTNQVVHRNSDKPAHSSQVIDKVIEDIAVNEKQPDGLEFGDRTIFSARTDGLFGNMESVGPAILPPTTSWSLAPSSLTHSGRISRICMVGRDFPTRPPKWDLH